MTFLPPTSLLGHRGIFALPFYPHNSHIICVTLRDGYWPKVLPDPWVLRSATYMRFELVGRMAPLIQITVWYVIWIKGASQLSSASVLDATFHYGVALSIRSPLGKRRVPCDIDQAG